MATTKLISCDDHMDLGVLPADLWQTRLPAHLRDRAPHIAEKDGQSVAIQCKRHGNSVGVAAVQQVVSGARHHGCTKSIVVSNQEFTQAAKQLAFTHGCQLIGRKALQA